MPGWVGRLVSTVAVFALFLVPSGAAAPYLQAGVDAARTGVTTDPGPATFDAAFWAKVPGRLAGTPLVFDGTLFVATFATPWEDDPASDAETSGIWRVSLDSASVSLLVGFDPPTEFVSGFASDGRLLFVNVGHDLRAYEAQSGSLVWSFAHRIHTSLPPLHTVCRDPAVSNGTVFVACYQRGSDAGTTVPSTVLEGPTNPVRIFVVAIDAATGKERWTWVQDATEEGSPDTSGMSAGSAWGWASGILVVGGRPFVATVNPDRAAIDPQDGPLQVPYPKAQAILWALDEQGDEDWWYSPGLEAGGNYGYPYYGLPMAASSKFLLLGAHSLIILDPQNGAEQLGPDFQEPALGDTSVGRDAGRSWASGTPLAILPDAWYLGSREALHRIDPLAITQVWRTSVAAALLGPTVDERSTVLAAGSRIFIDANPATDDELKASALTVVGSDGTGLWQGLIPDRGPFSAPVGQEPVQPERHLTTGNMAIGDGILAYVSSDGNILIMGRTKASIVLDAVTADASPAPGAVARLDLSSTKPGVHGPANEYRVSWGDGNETGWQASPRFEHTYQNPGDHVATAFARNPAGQTASQTILFRVGGDEPAAAGFLPTLRNIGPVFGAIGILSLSALVGAVAVSKRRAKGAMLTSEDRTNVYRAALERAVGATGEVAAEFDGMLQALRGELGLTERDHGILLATVRAGRAGHHLVLAEGATVLGKYEIKERLAEGGQGAAYLARDRVLARDVVVKVVSTARGDDAVILREARTLASLRHANIVTIFDVDRVGESVFLVMERLTESLKHRLERGPLSGAAFSALAGDVLSALSAVHEAGMLHLDVKPANVLLTQDGRGKLADFGIAHRPGTMETMVGLRPEGPISGTAAYMSPEQARGQPLTRRSDLYSAALVLFEAWTGQAYFEARPNEGAFDVQMRVAAGHAFAAQVKGAPALHGWFARALNPDPMKRFGDADAMLRALLETLPRAT